MPLESAPVDDRRRDLDGQHGCAILGRKVLDPQPERRAFPDHPWQVGEECAAVEGLATQLGPRLEKPEELCIVRVDLAADGVGDVGEGRFLACLSVTTEDQLCLVGRSLLQNPQDITDVFFFVGEVGVTEADEGVVRRACPPVRTRWMTNAWYMADSVEEDLGVIQFAL